MRPQAQPFPFIRHSGGTSAISNAPRQYPFALEIAGQARNDDIGEWTIIVENE